MATPEEIQAQIAQIEARMAQRQQAIDQHLSTLSNLPGTDLTAARASDVPFNAYLPEGTPGIVKQALDFTPDSAINAAEALASFGGPIAGMAAPIVGQGIEQAVDYFGSGDAPYVPDMGTMALEAGLGAMPFGGGKATTAMEASQVAGKEAAQYAGDPMVQQGLKAAEAQLRDGSSPFGLLKKPAEATDPLGKHGQNALNEMAALSEGPYATGAATGVAPRVNQAGQGRAAMVSARQDPIHDTGLFSAGPEIDLFAEGPVAKFKPGPAPMSLDDTVNRIATAKEAALQARDDAAKDLDAALQVLAAKAQDPTQALRGIKFQDIAGSFDQLRAKAKGLMMNTPTQGEGRALMQVLSDLDRDFDKIRSQVMMRRPSYGVISGAQEMGELLPSEAAQMLSNFNRARRTLGEFDTNTIARALAGNAGKMGEYQILTEGYAAVSEALRTRLDDISEAIITQAKAHPSLNTNPALMAVEKYDPNFVRRMNSTYSALDPMEKALATRSREISEAMGPPAAKGLNAVVSDAAQIPTSKTGMFAAAGNKVVDVITNPLSPAAQKQALLRQAQTDPIEQLKFFAMMRERQALPKLPRSVSQIVKDTKASNLLISSLIGLNLITDPREWTDAPLYQQQKMLELLGTAMPQAFQKNKDGYQSEFNGVIRSPIEQSMHLRAAIDSGDLKTQANVFDGLAQGGKYRPLPSAPAVPIYQPEPEIEEDPYSAMMAPIDMYEGEDGSWGSEPETDAETSLQKMQRLSGAYNSGY